MVKYYGGGKRELTQAYLDSIDILITTPHTSPFKRRGAGLELKCRRLILDESHLYEKKASPKLPPRRVFEVYRPSFVWCVTGTPFSNDLNQLETQARMLGHWSSEIGRAHV